jgi:beta-N-acetylhexosaminidase
VPATVSRPIMGRLRDAMGFDGLVVTDALIMDGAVVGGGSRTPRWAVCAGVDLLLYPGPRRVRGARPGARDGTLPRARLELAWPATAGRRPPPPRPRAGHPGAA